MTRRIAASCAMLAATACGAPMEIFSTASDAAERTTTLAWFMIILSGAIFAGVMIAMLIAARRNRSRDPREVDLAEPGKGWIIWGGAVMPVVVLGLVFIVSLGAMSRFPGARPVVTIHVTGHQWWWQLDYELGDGSHRFRSANELHIPVGRPVRLLLTSTDVIHSFWVPQLQGKLDVIPGDTNDLRLNARRPGVYTGACAEFCGRQHAHMQMSVVAEDSASFERWASGQVADAATPSDSVTMLGRRLFESGTCATCHTIRGTSAVGLVGPDLSHVASRRTIAAGTVPNTLGGLGGWIANPQALKPGTLMPTPTAYLGPELRAIAGYLASLK